MKKILTCFLVLSLFHPYLNSQTPAGEPVQARVVTQVSRSIVSPEILPDNRVTFRIMAPRADTVRLVCDWLQWNEAAIDMVKSDTGIWSTTIGPLKPEFYGYTFNIDGVTVLDPLNPLIKRDVRNNTSILLVSGTESSDLYSIRDVPHGTVSKVWYNSPVLNLNRRMTIYTPPGYEENDRLKYPVLYLLHGSGNDEDGWSELGKTPVIMDNLIARGKAIPMIVVMTNGNAGQMAAMGVSPTGPLQGTQPGARGSQNAGRFEESLVKDIVPFIESRYRVLTDRNYRAIAGLSMGGGQTVRITLSNPEMFSYIGVYSMGIRRVTAETENQFEVLKSKNVKLYWVGCGITDQIAFQGTQTLVSLLKKYGINYVYRESSGGHTWANWRIYLSEMAPLLFK